MGKKAAIKVLIQAEKMEEMKRLFAEATKKLEELNGILEAINSTEIEISVKAPQEK